MARKKKRVKFKKLMGEQVAELFNFVYPPLSAEEPFDYDDPIDCEVSCENDDAFSLGVPEFTDVSKDTFFTSDALEELSHNEFRRYINDDLVVGHALIFSDSDGQLQAKQVRDVPSHPNAPQIVSLSRFERHDLGDKVVFKARADDGTMMYSAHAIDVSTNYDHSPYQLHYFRPVPQVSDEWSFYQAMQNPVPVFKPDYAQAQAKLKDNQTDINPGDIPTRKNMRRSKSQTKVMRRSAWQAMVDFGDDYEEQLTDEAMTIVDACIEARQFASGAGVKRQPFPEWNHAVGHGLSPMSYQPQRKSNLAAAPAYINTQMMNVERSLQWHALNKPGDYHVHTKFTMLENTDVLDYGWIEGTFQRNEKKVSITSHLNPWVKNPHYMRASHVAQTSMVVEALLSNQAMTQTCVCEGPSPSRMDELLTQMGELSLDEQSQAVAPAKPLLFHKAMAIDEEVIERASPSGRSQAYSA